MCTYDPGFHLHGRTEPDPHQTEDRRADHHQHHKETYQSVFIGEPLSCLPEFKCRFDKKAQKHKEKQNRRNIQKMKNIPVYSPYRQHDRQGDHIGQRQHGKCKIILILFVIQNSVIIHVGRQPEHGKDPDDLQPRRIYRDLPIFFRRQQTGKNRRRKKGNPFLHKIDHHKRHRSFHLNGHMPQRLDSFIDPCFHLTLSSSAPVKKERKFC